MPSEYPPRVTDLAQYGATDSTNYSGTTTLTLTNASVTFTTATVNTKWLITISADLLAPTGIASIQSAYLVAVVDGSNVTTDGVHRVQTSFPDGPERIRTTVGRVVVTLATAASHTIGVKVSPNGGGSWVVGVGTLTVQQLTG
jgi:hypothetical protein